MPTGTSLLLRIVYDATRLSAPISLAVIDVTVHRTHPVEGLAPAVCAALERGVKIAPGNASILAALAANYAEEYKHEYNRLPGSLDRALALRPGDGDALRSVLGQALLIAAVLAVALLIPFTFHLPATQGLILLGAAYTSTVAGGAVSAILLKIPGAPANIAR